MNNEYHLFWGDSHHQTYIPTQDPPLQNVLEEARRYLDFYSSAYYMKEFTFAPPLESQRVSDAPSRGHLHENPASTNAPYRGVHLEGSKSDETLLREWADVQRATAAAYRPGEFVTFPGYEWQGNGRWGDHNVIYRYEGPEMCNADSLPELYEFMRTLEVESFAIPHHTGYLTRMRAPDWSFCDDALSPYAEVYSVHGCSETDEEWIGLRHNPHMGPGVGGSTWQDALTAGLHLGAICSTDNWTMMPGHYGQGLMAVLAEDLTRDSLWDAFSNRRVYGETGDRMELDFTCNGAPMGSILPAADRRELYVHVQGMDAIDRIELLRNDRVIATHSHQGTWQAPKPGTRSRWTVRLELGWGPLIAEFPVPDKKWQGSLQLSDGRMLDWQPCWVSLGQPIPTLTGSRADFEIATSQHLEERGVRNALVFEFEADPDATLELQLDGPEPHKDAFALIESVASVAERSHLLWDKAGSVETLRQVAGVTPAQAEHTEAYYHFAHKLKVHKAMPESARTATLTFVDDEPLHGETHYRVRVEQRNGQRAWSSPIWIQA